jgi:hypothetical protein
MTFPVVGNKVQFKGPKGLIRGQVVKIEKLPNFTGTANPWFIHVEYNINSIEYKIKPTPSIYRLSSDSFKTVKFKVIA